jgi:hypothetical protein
MRNFLPLLESKLPQAQALRIAAIVAQKQSIGEIATGRELSEEVARLLQLVRRSEDFEPALRIFELNDPRAIMEADQLNGAMEELSLDLKTLYDVTNQLTGTSTRLQKVLHSQLEELRAGLCRLSDDILGHRIQKNSQFARVITQGFADGRNLSQAGRKAEVDPRTRSLKLPARVRERYHDRRGVNPAQVTITQLSGGLAGVASRSFEPENCIDPDLESFWAEVLLSDAPIRTDYVNLDGSTTSYDGALVEIELEFGGAEFVTDVKILPFGIYPIDIIDVKIRQGDNYFAYPGFVDRSPALNWLEWHGPRIQADSVVFVLNQKNYERRRYHIPTSLVQVSNFWEQLLDEETQLTLQDQVLTQFQQQRAEADGRFRSLHEGLSRYGVEIERLDLQKPDPESRTVSEADSLGKEVDAAVFAMSEKDSPSKLQLSHLRAGSERESGITEIERVEYVFGAREIQANEIDYYQEARYASPRYASDSTILEIQLNTDEEHPTFTDTGGDYRQTSIEYEIELAPGRRVPLLPKGTTTVQDELLVIDRTTREDTTRLPAVNTTVQVRRGGDLLAPTDYTVTQLATGHLRVTMTAAAFFRSARYSISYTPAADQDLFKVTDTFDSVALDRPEVFSSTDEAGSLELQHFPYVEYGVINDESRFRREARRSARYFWLGGLEQHFLDNMMFGDVNTALNGAITATDTTITLTTVLGLEAGSGSLKIENEIITYTGISSNDLTGVTRGTNGTAAQAHADATEITGLRTYEPLIVKVGNIKATNITDYESGEHPAFLATSEATAGYEFLHIGKRLFLNRPVTNKPITVEYRWMSQYVQVHALLRSHTVGRVAHTPILNRYHLEIASTVL